MAKIVAGYDIYPTDADVNLDDVITAIPKAIPEGIRILEADIRPVAFGLKKVFVGFMIESEDEDIGTRLEDSLRAIENVENVECVTTSNV
ncbi:MAG: translation elongation factor EF-1beta [Thermoplasmatales archaeon]|nr:translation elongation factor EF-1beta [Thermoplasmatales archaeon]